MSRDLERATTLAELFPGNLGRLQFVRVLLRSQAEGLGDHPWEEPLPPHLLDAVRKGIQEDESR